MHRNGPVNLKNTRRQNERNQKWLHGQCCLGVPKAKRDQSGYMAPAFLGSPEYELRFLLRIMLVAA